ncbi:hypothetical protein DFO70_11829 [Cytobacillus firmus]|uniref:Uncharacterized protein n=2 Tax=Cytobacillus TaxID=2675230 RepID=A0A366JKZ4_CYTFI|nr:MULTISPECIES: hypothetical protein [Cytobacillus]RBP87607.1 hypothetical protein DFO70_11829 [Cytobacillus firmus]TDX39433.1 hypothetical protein DFO72_11029 [Cytobacillus oceanisediminis]
MEFFREKERLLIQKNNKLKGVCNYQGSGYSGVAFHLNEKGRFGGLDFFVASKDRWQDGGA